MSAGRDDKAKTGERRLQRERAELRRVATKQDQLNRRKVYRARDRAMKGLPPLQERKSYDRQRAT
jgi:hypothetical protein